MNRIKILILTHKLGTNYGGILQAYALQKVLSNDRFNATTSYYGRRGTIYGIAVYVKYLIKKMLHTIMPDMLVIHPSEADLISTKTMRFVTENMNTINGVDVVSAVSTHQYDVLITGSDQVWRSVYVPVDKYLFDFAEDIKGIKRISYAASFGRDDLTEYSPRLLKRSAQLAKKFDAISVREKSGIDLVNANWGMEAEQHVDPTLLLDKKHYLGLIKDDKENTLPSPGNLFCYLLDSSVDKTEIVKYVCSSLGLVSFEIMPPKATSYKQLKSNVSKYQLPPVTQWLRSFNDAKFVVTDSFHGTVFAIIFNKPFISIGNNKRGMTRFSSLLELFGLGDRLVVSPRDVTKELINKSIDWASVNTKIKAEQKRSFDYLKEHLG